MKVLIVDDEFNTRRMVRKIISDEFPMITFLNDASNVDEAIAIINDDEPDILLLDIQLNSKTSFEILNEIDKSKFEIIFITAYDDYALKAFDVGAASYILKPIDRAKLIETFKNVKNRIESSLNMSSSNNLPDLIPTEKILLPNGESSKIVDAKDILYVQAAGMYCDLYFVQNRSKLLIAKPLNFVAEKLANHVDFFRIHKSYLINLSQVESISSDRSHLVLLDKTVLPIARLRRDELKERLKNYFY